MITMELITSRHPPDRGSRSTTSTLEVRNSMSILWKVLYHGNGTMEELGEKQKQKFIIK